MSTNVVNRFIFVFVGCIAAMMFVMLIVYNLLVMGRPPISNSVVQAPDTEAKISTLAAGAFGKLALTSGGLGASPESLSSAQRTGGGGGGPTADAATNVMTEPAVAPVGDTKMVDPGFYYPIIQYTYTYTGEPIDLSTVSDAVYKKTTGLELGNSENGLKRAQVGPISLDAFKNTKVQSFSLTQTDKNGYSIYVDSVWGSISISGNEGVWAYDNNYQPLTEADRLSDEAGIALANDFLAQYNIDASSFGSPSVDDRDYVYALSQPEGFRYFPETMSITYPLLIEGQPAYNSDGSAHGLNVMLSLRTQRVASVNLNYASSFEKSAYDLERDPAVIQKLAEQGGLYSYPIDPSQSDVQNIPIELGTPSIILISHYNYNGSTSEQMYVPAISFPVTKNSDTYPVYNDAIVIPLVKDILEATTQPPIYRVLEDTVTTEPLPTPVEPVPAPEVVTP